MNTEKVKRPRIAKGILVRSTNEQQQDCVRVLADEYIIHLYNPLNYKRIRRYVQHNN